MHKKLHKVKRKEAKSCLVRPGVCKNTRWIMLGGFKDVGSDKLHCCVWFISIHFKYAHAMLHVH
eukprot:330952-Pelagomonas_calceolata.AAC.1